MNTIVVKQTVTRNMFGPQVADGWTPLLAAVEDGERRVFQITDWIGGTGDKPPVGLYLGEHGLVPTPAEATDIGVPTDYSSRDAVAAARIPPPVQYIRTAGYAEPGDGGGALYARVAFEPGHAGKVQSADGAWWELVEVTPNVLQYAPNVLDWGHDTTSFTGKLQAALAAKPGDLLIPKSPSMFWDIEDTCFIPAGTVLHGVGKFNPWGGDTSVGTILRAVGSGPKARWTDIDGSDDADFSPLLVINGNSVVLQDVAVHCAVDADWSAGIYNPANRQMSLARVLTKGPFKKSGVYLDATWSSSNTALTALHPEVYSSGGLNEISIEGCFLDGGLWGLMVQGTTRNPDDYSSGEWVWSPGGTSDISISASRLGCSTDIDPAIRLADGGSLYHDAAIKNAAGAGQGIYIVNSTTRSNALYQIKLDRTHGLVKANCYGENPGQPVAVALSVTDRTGSISSVNDRSVGQTWKNGVPVGTSSSSRPWSMTRRSSLFTVDGRLYTPNIEAAPTETDVVISSFSSTGRTRFAHDDGTGSTAFLNVDVSGIRPVSAGALSLGSTSFPFNIVNSNELRVSSACRPLTDNSVSLGSSSYRWSQVYAGTDTINTSDERFKKNITPVESAVLDAWGEVEWCQYKFLDAIEQKGSAARWHVGLVAQRIAEVFSRHGLDAMALGLVCYDEWPETWDDEEVEEEYEAVNESGEMEKRTRTVKTGRKINVREAGSAWGVRYAEALALEAAWQRRRADRIEARLDALEAKAG